MPRRPTFPSDKPTSVALDADVREYILKCVAGGRSTMRWIINDAVRSKIAAGGMEHPKSNKRRKPANPLPV